jgi:hypothetical protein
MANMHSRFEPESSILSAQRRNSEFIELDLTHHLRKEATEFASAQASSHTTKNAPMNSEPVLEMAASTPRRVSIYDSNIELNDVSPQHDEAGAGEVQFSLPPVDTGKDAWLFLFSAFVMDILVWGIFYIELLHSACTNTTQASLSPLASFRNTTPHIHHSKVSETLQSSVPVPWV